MKILGKNTIFPKTPCTYVYKKVAILFKITIFLRSLFCFDNGEVSRNISLFLYEIDDCHLLSKKHMFILGVING